MSNLNLSNIVERPWGWFTTTFQANGYKTKVFVVKPMCRISLQTHARRKEIWSIVDGEGICTIGDGSFNVKQDSSMLIPLGAKHRIQNTSNDKDLVVSEVQIGDYLEEDDIIRYEDDFGRH